jgi:hypothetical protein
MLVGVLISGLEVTGMLESSAVKHPGLLRWNTGQNFETARWARGKVHMGINALQCELSMALKPGSCDSRPGRL